MVHDKHVKDSYPMHVIWKHFLGLYWLIQNNNLTLADTHTRKRFIDAVHAFQHKNGMEPLTTGRNAQNDAG